MTESVRPMTAARVLLAALLMAAGLVLAASSPATAAPCACQAKPLKRALAGADLVVTGTVTSRDDDSTPERFTLTLSRVYAGDVTDAAVTFQQSANCPVPNVQTGQDWVILAVLPKAEGELPRVSRCSGSRPLTAPALAKVEAQLGTGKAAPKPPPPAATFTKLETVGPKRFRQFAAPGAAMVLIGLLGLGLVRTLARPKR